MAANSQSLLDSKTNKGVEKIIDIKDPTPLQRHVIFFDINNDGIVYPSETFKGCRRLGVGIFLSTVTAVFVNGALSRRTRPGKGFSFRFPIEIKNIHRGKHGSDTDVFDTEGRFVESKFEEIFAKHAHTNKDYLTSNELNEMLKANREPRDYLAWFGAYTEWRLLFSLGKEKEGFLRKETLRAFYDGSLFYQLAEKRASKK
ncbi:hypothetical protein M9H77_08681 [Catharanthus roseus]|uniref:Uncharacterized protein n=1 Tax=Catharanthus roseus TaxID=4058 RepID=A0ACC0BYH1_CATRO|nr:hypothetical protein M9H77_08681 [Catharanthus roseus]